MLCLRQLCQFHALKHVSICFSLPVFQSGACGQRSLEKDEPRAAGSLQKSEAKAKEKVIYTLYTVYSYFRKTVFEVAGNLKVDLLSHWTSKQQEMWLNLSCTSYENFPTTSDFLKLDKSSQNSVLAGAFGFAQ